ncbi:MAG: response regulator transcription factor [Bacteroidetes bacterium]|nr:response regulator transcription factor [Bacteroidota bacterium]
MKIINILIADDHIMFAEGLRMVLKQHPDFTVNAIAHNGKELLDLLQRYPAEVLLLDLNMPSISGLDALQYIRRTNKTLKIIILSTYDETHLISKAREEGANGYLKKTFSTEELIEVIYLVATGGEYFPNRVKMKQNIFPETDSFEKQFSLTKREKEIIILIGQHLTNSEISEKLFLSKYTVETHRKNIMHKLGLKSPGELIRFITENNLH